MQAREKDSERGTHDRVNLDGVLKGAHSGDLNGSHVEDVDTGHVTEELVSLDTGRLLVVGGDLEGGCARSHWLATEERRRRETKVWTGGQRDGANEPKPDSVI